MAFVQVKNTLQTWRIAAFTVAFFSSFFSPFIIANTAPDSVSPDMDQTFIFNCLGHEGEESSCLDHLASLINADANRKDASCSVSSSTIDSPAVGWKTIYIDCPHQYSNNGGETWVSTSQGFGTYSTQGQNSASCPPDDYPDYVFGKDMSGDGEIDSCWKSKLDKCPDGYIEFKVGGECIPVTCDSAGTQTSVHASGSVYSNNAGTYCDGSCAHSVSGGQNDSGYQGKNWITGVSTGESCGQGNDVSMNDGDGAECTSTDVGTGTNFMSCPSGTSETPSEPPPVDINSEKSEAGDIPTLNPIEEICPASDPSCEIRNLKEKIESEGQEKKKLDVKLHDKRIEAASKVANNMVKTINESGERTSDGLKVVSDAVKDLATEIGNASGGGGGGGQGTETTTSGSGELDKSLFDALFNDAAKAALELEIKDIETDIKNFINTTRAQATSMMSITVPSGGGYEARNLTLSQGTFDLSLSRFSAYFSMLASPILLICAILAAFIILGGKDK